MSQLSVAALSPAEAAPYRDLLGAAELALAQQTVAWSEVIAPLGPDTPWFLVAREAGSETPMGGLPLYHYEAEPGSILTSVPQAGPLGGVVLRRGLDGETRARVTAALKAAALDLARELSVCALTVISNPFTQDELDYASGHPPDLVLENFCQVLDVERVLRPEGDAWVIDTGKSSHDRIVRKNLNKARKSGLEVGWGTLDDFQPWYEIHVQRHTELGARPLPRALLENLLHTMGAAGTGGLVVVRSEGTLCGGCLFIWGQTVVDAFIMSASQQSLQLGTNYAITDFTLRWARERGLRWFNWQSCPRASGVFTFKRRWGSQELPYAFLTWTLPGFQRLLALSPAEVGEHYPGHYVAPFEAVQGGLARGRFKKP